LQLKLTATYFTVIFLFQLQLQLTEGTLVTAYGFW